MQPLVTIILPTYNVEPYLRQCLDSLVNQTIRDIQIICVNDGSTDGSLAILKEYADKDSRIEVIDQENRGGGSARNAGYPHIRGKYTYFVDPDDWLEPNLCEKTSKKMEETNADVLYLDYFREHPDVSLKPSRKFCPELSGISITPEHRALLLNSCNSTWRKFWKSEFLLDHQIYFSEGKRPCNDIAQNWHGCILANQIAILTEPLYHHRCVRPDSYQTNLNRKHFVIIDTMDEVRERLKKIGKYDEYGNIYLTSRLVYFHNKYLRLANEYRAEFRLLVLEALTEEDRRFLHSASPKTLPWKVRVFYRMLERQGFFAKTAFHIHGMCSQLERTIRRNVVNRLKHFFR